MSRVQGVPDSSDRCPRRRPDAGVKRERGARFVQPQCPGCPRNGKRVRVHHGVSARKRQPLKSVRAQQFARRYREGDAPRLASPETGLSSVPPRVRDGDCNGLSAGMRRAASGDHSLVTCLSFRGGRPDEGAVRMSFPISPVPVGPRLGTAPSSPTVGRRAQRSAPRVSERSSLSWPDSPAAFAPRPVQPATRREAGWHGPLSPEAQARLYLEILEESDYAERLAPVVGGEHRDVLDIGAGNGALSRRCLARPAR